MSRELMAQVIGDFGQEIGAQLEVDEEAYCCFAVGEEFQLHLKFNEHFDGLILYAELGELPSIGKKEILRHYVMQNGSTEVSNVTFSYDQENKNIGVSYLLPKEFLNLDNFKKILEKFIGQFLKEIEEMKRFVQGELPQDNLQFLEDTGESGGDIPAGNANPMIMQL
ncbi:MAG: type III secretion system chaperone [Puniceicoccales bacterium]|nr:type III secretion system chaperone [Puniceicoccales bacterium]